MKRFAVCLTVAVLAFGLAGCAHIGGGTDLGAVAKSEGMINITTGDGTFENYTATGYHTGLEIGIAIGLPQLFKFMELYPKQDNEAQLAQIAQAAQGNGANAMINVTPPQEMYLGFPFGIIGLYFDTCEGTGIKTK